MQGDAHDRQNHQRAPARGALQELAKATARTKSFLTIDALTNYVQRESWQIRDIHEGVQEADAGEFATDSQVEAVFAKYGA